MSETNVTRIEDAANKSKNKRGLNGETKKKLITGAIALVSLLTLYFVYESYFYVSTDNAMVQAPTTLLSAQISGVIIKSDVDENQKVKTGQVLVEIQPDDFQAVLDEKTGDRDALAAQFKGAQLNYQRTRDLYGKGASTKERLDNAEAQFKSLESKLKSAEAEAEVARLNLEHTKIAAPVDGVVGRKSFEVGMLAAARQPLLGFVANNERWVTANLKETDMDAVTAGEKAYVTVDAISGREFEGVVESVSPATGATFTLLPPDNATGNFTKVVQRVPVRIKLLNINDRDTDRLQNGLSAEVKIRVH